MKAIDLKHFDIPEPLLIGMSGGQTSAMQLRLFLDALGGKIHGRRVVTFANTGMEHEKTLVFVDRISREWDVKIHWLEYRFEYFPAHVLCDPAFIDLRVRQFTDRKDRGLRAELAQVMDDIGFPEQAGWIRGGRESLNGRGVFVEVDLLTASRKGEPFQVLLEAREQYRMTVKGLPGVLPCPVQRMCTGELKIRTMNRFCAQLWGEKHHTEHNVALALRADEGQRIETTLKADLVGGEPYFPMADAGIKREDVAAFWAKQPFRLGLKGYEGNCRYCFMKKVGAVETLIREDPGGADWWAEWEERTGDFFRRDRSSYREMQWQARHQLQMFDEPAEGETMTGCADGYCSD